MNETVFHIFSTTVNTRDPGRSQAGIFPAIFYEKNNAGCYALTMIEMFAVLPFL